ncbi:hypothetical protein GH5_06171 [Leishmania sp. Ghana 2012 LV757]|uniref:hypothetical protein n=1 Tax=Leishmania sp. Ghana 2012 LV757 TaxID=2803181 RepID=UPI001B6AFD8E|nr:hypothetical protein GH5_06171 [Leishmania sp. Ghana 2012 LV757]
MFILRIAGDVEGVRRNIEVTFPYRPSLQQVCTVAETILPLRGRGDRQPWRPPFAASTQSAGGSITSTAASFRAPAEPNPRIAVSAARYVVESLVYLNRATHEWEALYSASQLTSGVQVYCFCPLQRHRATSARRTGSSSAFSAQEAHMNEDESPVSQVPVNLPEGTGAPQTWANPGPPGAIPEPQQRLLWDCVSTVQGRARQTAQGVDGGCSHIEFPSPSPTHASLLNNGDMTHTVAARLRPEPVPPSSSHDRRFSSFLPFRAAALGASAWSALSTTAGGASGALDKVNPPSVLSTPSFSTSARQGVAGLVRSASPPTRRERCSSVEAQGWKRSPSQRPSRSSRLRDDRFAPLSYLSPDWSALLLSGAGGGDNRYAHLGDRLALLFDVLVHLDPREGDAGQRRYILLRDFHLLASCFTSASAAAAVLPRPSDAAVSVCGTPDPSTVMNVTAELDRQLHWTWGDVVRHADKDRDGCISYCEWISFGIEHPEVVQLLCRAVHTLLMRQEASSMGRCSGRHRSPGAQTAMVAPLGHLVSNYTPSTRDRGGGARSSEGNAGLFSGVLRFHRVGPGQVDGTRAERNRATRVAAVPGLHGGRCEACRVLQGERPEGCRGRASAPVSFTFTSKR